MRSNSSQADTPFLQNPPSFLAGYGLALATTTAAALIRWMLPWALATVPYLIFSPAVVVSAALGGVGPGLVTTFASLLLVNFVFGGFDISSHAALIRLIIWTASSIGVCFLAGGQRAARQRAEQEAETARAAEQALLKQVKLIDSARAEVIAREMQQVVYELGDEHAVPDETPAKTSSEKLGRVPTVTGATVAVVGLLVLCGWLFGLEAFKSVLPGLATMKANTALCFLLAGMALALRQRRTPRLACAGTVCAVAGLTLVEYLTGADLGIDQLLFRDTVDPHTLYPGRMVQATALGFVLSGASLLLLEARAKAGRQAQQALAVGAAVIGAVALLGYAYDAQQLYRFAGYSSMALHTAATLVTLVTGLIFARPDGLAMVLTTPGPAAILVRRLLPVALLMPAFLGWLIGKGLKQGFYGAGMEVVVLVMAMMLSLAALVWWTAHAVNVADAARHQTEMQLRHQAELMDHAYEPLIVRKQGGAILFWNRGAEVLYGWPAAEAVGRHKQALLHTEGCILEAVDRQLETTGHWEGELVHTTRDGRRIVIDSRQTATRATDGRLLILESNRDITARKQAQEALNNLMREQSIILENIPIGISKIVDRKQVWINRRTEEMFQYTSEDMLFQTTRNLYPSDEAYEKLGQEAYPVLAQGGVFETEQELIRKDGSTILVRYIGSVIDPADMSKGALWLLEDITERKEAEVALKRSEEKLSLALRSAEMGVWQFDLRDKKRHFDDQVCRCLGIDPNRFDGSAEEFYAAVHPDDRDELKARFIQTIGSGAPYEAEYRAVWPDGRIRHVAARGRLALDAAGQPRRVDGLVWDITESKMAEERLQASLREKEVMLKEIHHRVKNNLQVISSLVSLQAEGSGDASVREVLRDVTYRVRSMALVHEKLYQSADLAHVDFAEYIRSLLNYLWRAHGTTAAAVRLIFDLEPLSLPVDTAVPCGLILNELAGNTLKHAFRGRDTGEVTVSLRSAPEGRILLSLRDNGVGMPAGLDWRQARSLGLRLVQMLAGQLKATVEVSSGEGTSFEITFEVSRGGAEGAEKTKI